MIDASTYIFAGEPYFPPMLRTKKKNNYFSGMKKEMDSDNDYLPGSFGQITATELSNLSDGVLSHDKITRRLSGNEYISMDLWREVKSLVRKNETEKSCLIFDDTIVSKPCTDENDRKGGNEKDRQLIDGRLPYTIAWSWGSIAHSDDL
jgi:hypothetical protein